MKEVFKAINNLNWALKILMYAILIMGTISLISMIFSLFIYLG